MACDTTEDLSPLEEIIGQDRAVRALRFGIDIAERGFNIFVAGVPGTGKTTAVKDFLEEVAKTKPVPTDWCYVHNFQNPYEPNAISLPPGMAKIFQKDMANFIQEVRKNLPKVFESDEYARKREITIGAIEKEREQLFAELNMKAQAEGFILQSSPIGLLTIPVVKGRPLNEKDFLSLSPEVRAEIQKKRDVLEAELRSAMRQLRGLARKTDEAIRKMDQEVALYTIEFAMSELKEKYKNHKEIVDYLIAVQNDILENLEQFVSEPKTQAQQPFPWVEELPFRKYEVKVVVDNSSLRGAPVVLEQNPTYQNLFGRIEKEARLGVLSTDFTMIHGGSLHAANGGYLVLPAGETLGNMFTWDSLKRALMNREIMIEEAGERLGFITTKGLKPEPIPLNVKVILIGSPLVYELLVRYDPQFKELFKVKADFDTVMDRTEENMRKYAAFICTFCKKEKLKHLDASAVSKIIAYGSRLAEDQAKLSTRFAEVADIIREANFYAVQEGSNYITASHVKKAIEEKIYRSNLIQEKIKEMIKRGVLLIDTEGSVVGQVNGLSVTGFGDFSFGMPSRLTASIGIGREGVVDIEREAKLGGPIHTKGVLILSGYLSNKYAQDKPLTLSARLVFEQSYSGVEGDSASSAELYALLSALSGIPIKQSIAVTGSVNQKGEVQAIGGVNEKIEGFYEVCKAKGLTGKQGVMIPESNVQNLMLKEEIVEAVKAGKFHIYSVKTIDEGIEVLTGVKAGNRKSDGTFEENTVNSKVDKRLREMAEKLKEFPEAEASKRKEE
ncbi:AAA family ATPase [Candidatus Bathyarchaeota archaeon]|nr:AAA family ATPase [Candidatus Bathyarchaeota archaeon]